jgi:hypothetical protein
MHGAKDLLIPAAKKGPLAIASLDDAAVELERQRLLDMRWARRRSMLLFARRTALEIAVLIFVIDGNLPIGALVKSLF